MEKFASKQYLFLEFLAYLTYQEIARLREVSKSLCDRIDSIEIWTKVIERDHPSLIILTSLSTTVSLSLLKNISQHRTLTPTKCINIGSIGSLGQFQAELNEPIALARNGFLGCLKEFVCNIGYCRYNLVSFPSVDSAKCQKKIIETFLILSKCQAGWEEELINILRKVEEAGINKIIIGLRRSDETKFVSELRAKYNSVILVDALTLENLKRTMRLILSVTLDMSILNTEDQEGFAKKVTDEVSAKKAGEGRKCEVF